MFRNKLSLLLAGAAAFGYYKYSKMSAEEKNRLISDLKEKGKKLYGQFMPSSNSNDLQPRPVHATSATGSMNTSGTTGSRMNTSGTVHTGTSSGSTQNVSTGTAGSNLTGGQQSHGIHNPDLGDQRSDSYERGIHPMG